MYEQAKKYFSENKGMWLTFAIILTVGGLFAAVAFFCNSSEDGMIAVLVLAMVLLVGAFFCFKTAFPQGNAEADATYDNLAQSMMKFTKDDALAALGLDESEVTEAAPVCISGYSFDGADYVRLGADSRWRSNRFETWYLFFSSNEVHCCKKTIKTTADWKTESTDVYFYKDIVSVSTTSESKTVLNKKIDYDCFVLATAGGTSFKVSLKDVDNAQRSVNAMRSLLRAKKQEG